MFIELVIPSNHLILSFSSCPLSFPALRSFPPSQLFGSGGQSTGASTLVLQMNIRGWFPLGLTGLSSLLSKGLSKVSSSTTIQKHPFFSTQASLRSNSHSHTWLLEKPQLWLWSVRWCPYFLIWVSRFVITFLAWSKHPLISRLQSPSTVILESKKIKFATVSTFSPSICHELIGLDAMILVHFTC